MAAAPRAKRSSGDGERLVQRLRSSNRGCRCLAPKLRWPPGAGFWDRSRVPPLNLLASGS